jgi:phosphinothricin acetyltransferase
MDLDGAPGHPGQPRHTGRVRPATPADAGACAAIYAPYVEHTAVSFEERPPSVEEMRGRIESGLRTHAWVVLEDEAHGGRQVYGYAYAGPYKARPAYRWSCEVSVYVEQDHHRSGAGRALYLALFDRLVERGFVVAVAGMTLPNPASVGLHRALGFEDVGTWRGIGHKAGAWHDVHWMQRTLAGTGRPALPREPT